MKEAFDLAGYHHRVADGPCFVCALLAGDPDYRHHVVYEDGEHIAFLSRYPTLLGYGLVAPKAHIEDWVHEMDLDRFLRFQGVVHGVARAIAAVVPPGAAGAARPARRAPVGGSAPPRRTSAGQAVGLTSEATANQNPRPGVAYRPVRDAPPLPVWLAWRRDDPPARLTDLLTLVRETYGGEGMAWWWQVLIGVAGGLVLAWAALVVALLVAKPDKPLLREAMRLLPDLLRLLRRLAADPAMPRGVRVRLVLLLAYLALPIDLIPDFIPVLGYADDAIVVTLVLRGTVRRAGLDAVRAHWPGSDEGFAALCRLTGVS
jgi:uncharacterized membrane protein YkvA (DUF1232 family)